VLVVIVNTDRFYGCYSNGDVSYTDYGKYYTQAGRRIREIQYITWVYTVYLALISITQTYVSTIYLF